MSLETAARTLGGRIREKREATGKSIRATAKNIDMSMQYLSDIERGINLPSLEMLVRVSKELKTTPVELLIGISPFSKVRVKIVSDDPKVEQ